MVQHVIDESEWLLKEEKISVVNREHVSVICLFFEVIFAYGLKETDSKGIAVFLLQPLTSCC